jgi:hypothetical protein
MFAPRFELAATLQLRDQRGQTSGATPLPANANADAGSNDILSLIGCLRCIAKEVGQLLRRAEALRLFCVDGPDRGAERLLPPDPNDEQNNVGHRQPRHEMAQR